MPSLPDAHTHPDAVGHGICLACSTSAADWAEAAKVATAEVIPFFGIHPWFIADETWHDHLALLEDFLRRYPQAGIGETGLDKCRRGTVSLAVQKEVLRAHLELALTYQRPVTLHCCRAWGALRDIIADYPGVRLILHGWTGAVTPPPDALLSVGLREAGKRPGLIKSIPRNMLALESDGHPATLPPLYQLAASELDISVPELTNQVTSNIKGLLCL